MNVPFLDIKSQHATLKEAISAGLQEVLDNTSFAGGPQVARFEENFARFCQCDHAVGVGSGTEALWIALLGMNIGQGDEVITTPMTFGATANAILHSRAKPVFVDITLPSMNINPGNIEAQITDKTKAIVPVHFAGRPCDMKSIKEIAQKHHLIIIEDAAHALEATYHGQKVGTIGDLTVFSFYVTKNLVTGEGGMITTANSTYAEKIQTYALHGMSKGAWKRYSDEGFKHYRIVYPGFKYNMMDIQAALGIHQLLKIESSLKRREEIWHRYDDAFQNLPLDIPPPPEENTTHARHLYTILLKLDELTADRDTIQQALYEENIGTGIHFIALHLHPYYQETFGYKRSDYPNATYVSDRTISLPLSAKLTDEDVTDVIKAVTKVLTNYTK